MDLWEYLPEKLPEEGMPWKLLFCQDQEGRESGSHSICFPLEHKADDQGSRSCYFFTCLSTSSKLAPGHWDAAAENNNNK